MSPYRQPETVDPEPLRPMGCPCGTSPETRNAYSASGGWWHTDDCDRWRAWKSRATGKTVTRYEPEDV